MSVIDKAVLTVLCPVVFAGIIYLVGVWVSFEWNPADWAVFGRLIAALMWVMISVIVQAIIWD